MKIFNILFTAIILCSTAFAQTYQATDEGSKVHFTIKNFGIKVSGDFTGLKGTIVFNPKSFATSSMNVSVIANTINTDNSARDKHLRKEEYFNVEKFPLLSFVSTKITESSVVGRYFVIGNLTIKGVTKVVQFGFSATPSSTGYLFAGEFEINRKDFGVGGSSTVMADKVKVSINVSAKKQ
jgi:polyisoprenoid-binding protein YceI